MSVTTFESVHPRIAVEIKSRPKSRGGFWARVMHTLMEARLREAEREIRRYRHLIPQDELKIGGYRIDLAHDDELPFIR